jgi:mono/diheme cytochrome c family protein
MSRWSGWALAAGMLVNIGSHAGVSLAATGPATAAPATPPSPAGQVQRGEYLTRAGDCVSCHTAPGGKPFAGGQYMPTPFGEISVPNITPDQATGIGAWSDDEFYRAMHEGIGRHGEYLYPVFPFPWYTRVTREDVLAIRAYLRTVPAVSAPRAPLKLSFPASERGSLIAWRSLFFTAGEFKPDPHQSAQVNRGAYLVEGLGHCGECHNQHNEAGASRWSGSLEGGEIEGWYAPNLTADGKEGVGSWSAQDLTRFLHTGAAPHAGIALGPMQEVIQESLSHLNEADLQSISAYLKSVPPRETFKSVRTSEFAGTHPPGSGAYLTYCASCHGVDGQGFGKRVPPLKDNGAITAQGPQNVLRVVLGGLPATRGFAPMPAVGVPMTDQQVAEAVNYTRNAFGNHAPGTAEAGMVAQLRTQTRTTLAGNPATTCPAPAPAAITAAFNAQHVQQKLSDMNDTTMLKVLDSLAPTLRSAAPGVSVDELVNALTESYCGVLSSRKLTPAARAATLGNFAVLAYSQLLSRGRD